MTARARVVRDRGAPRVPRGATSTGGLGGPSEAPHLMNQAVRIITPTGHLGTTPLEKASFERGCAASPDFIVADSGSADIGPYPLGADKPASDEVWQRH